MTGHGGDKYMKIQYYEIFFSKHFADAIADAYARKRYGKVLTISDTCSAGTLFYTTDAPNGVYWGSSGWDEYSLSLGFDSFVGQPLKDRFSYEFNKWLAKLTMSKPVTLKQFVGKVIFQSGYCYYFIFSV